MVDTDPHRVPLLLALLNKFCLSTTTAFRQAIREASGGQQGEQEEEQDEEDNMATEQTPKRARLTMMAALEGEMPSTIDDGGNASSSGALEVAIAKPEVKLVKPVTNFRREMTREEGLNWQRQFFDLLADRPITYVRTTKDGKKEDVITPAKARVIVNFFTKMMDLDGLTHAQALIDDYTQHRSMVSTGTQAARQSFSPLAIPEAHNMLRAYSRMSIFRAQTEVGEHLKTFLDHHFSIEAHREYQDFVALVDPNSPRFDQAVHDRVQAEGFHTSRGVSWNSVVLSYLLSMASDEDGMQERNRQRLLDTFSGITPLSMFADTFSLGFLVALPVNASTQ